jgi:hypothetical protein
MPDPVHGSAADYWGGWHWEKPCRGEHFRRCSYCGSVHPEDVAATFRFKAGATADWADRKYGWPHKFYIHISNPDPAAIFCVGSASGGTRTDEELEDEGYIPLSKLNAEQRQVMERDGMGGSEAGVAGVRFGTRAEHFGKFYTVHLADPAIDESTHESIALGSGLRFHFEDGTVRWEAATGA